MPANVPTSAEFALLVGRVATLENRMNMPIFVAPPPDTTPPTVTINQAAGQADPTSASPINFAVVFSEPVSGFVGTDVTITGTAGGTKTVTVTGGPRIYNAAVSGMTTDGTVIASIASGVASDAAGNLNTASTSTDNTVSFTAYDPQIQWSATHESGTLLVSNSPPGDWDEDVLSGSALSTVVTAASQGITAHGGSYVLKQAVTGASGGTRMYRYEPVNTLAKAGTQFYWTWYDYYPDPITFSASDTFIPLGITGMSPTNSPNPVYGLVFHNFGQTLDLIWSPNNLAPDPGPHAGESGRRVYSNGTSVPVGQWVRFELMVIPKADFTGAVKLWMNNQVLFDLTLVKTMYPDVGQNGPLFGIEQTGYGSNLTPTPCIHYVDDVTLSLGRMP